MLRPGLVTSHFVAENIRNNTPNFKLLDASLKSGSVKASPKEEFLYHRIKNAKFFDIEHEFSDTSSPFPHTVPSLKHFKHQINRLSIHPDDFIVAYDSVGTFSAPRCWWLFKVMGWREEKVAVLDGGMAAFKEKYPELIDSTPLHEDDLHTQNTPPFEYENLKFREELIRYVDQIESNFEKKEEIVVDARAAGRFRGTAPEPRPHLRSGHMPFSLNVPFDSVLVDGAHFKSPEEIAALFASKGVDIHNANDKPIVNSCGSGITASILHLALHSSGCQRKVSVYDGSWSEYADTSVKQRPILTGDDNQ